MSQGYNDIPVTEKVYNSLSTLLERDETGVTGSAGTMFPQELESWMVGRLCLRTDLKTLYYLSSTDPVTWTPIVNFSQPLATQDYVQQNYQPLANNLTMLSGLTITADSVPYFNTATSMSTLQLNTFLKNVINAGNASDVRSLLGLGSLSTVDNITSSNVSTYITDSSLPISKFNFTPITAGEGYTTGDVKESYNPTEESGYIDLNKNYTIGDDSSGATYRGSTYNGLYVKLWGNPSVSYLTSSGASTTKGSSSTADWNAHKRIKLPSGTNYLNANCYYRIKV